MRLLTLTISCGGTIAGPSCGECGFTPTILHTRGGHCDVSAHLSAINPDLMRLSTTGASYMNLSKVPLLLLSAMAFLCFPAIYVRACVCETVPRPCEAFGKAKAVFIGRMIGGSERGAVRDSYE